MGLSRTSEKADKAKFAFWAFCELRANGVLPPLGLTRGLHARKGGKCCSRRCLPPFLLAQTCPAIYLLNLAQWAFQLREIASAKRKVAQTGEAAASVVRAKEEKMEYKEHTVPRGRYRIYAREYAGEEPAIVLMHGFPDNLHLYDRLVPHLSGRRVVLFDFLGWGRSEKPEGYPYTADNQTRDLDAVIEHLRIDDGVLVAHDASGPPAIDWALWHPERTAALVLLNTY